MARARHQASAAECCAHQRIAAEDAIKNSHPDAAQEYYEEGLDLYPTWPEGHFNAALIAAELGDYTML